MKLISKNVHDRLLRAAKRTEVKYADRMLDAKIPVNVRVLKELKLPVPAECEAKLQELDSAPVDKGSSATVATLVRVDEYLKALRAYTPFEPGKKDSAAK